MPSTFTVRFTFPAAASSIIVGELRGRYELSGDQALRPNAISDDGLRTYITWSADALLPATYVVDDGGREALANGEMRDGIYVLDGVSRRLLFRVDRKLARANRVPVAPTP